MFLLSRVRVRVLAVKLVSLRKTLNYCCVLLMVRKTVGPECTYRAQAITHHQAKPSLSCSRLLAQMQLPMITKKQILQDVLEVRILFSYPEVLHHVVFLGSHPTSQYHVPHPSNPAGLRNLPPLPSPLASLYLGSAVNRKHYSYNQK